MAITKKKKKKYKGYLNDTGIISAINNTIHKTEYIKYWYTKCSQPGLQGSETYLQLPFVCRNLLGTISCMYTHLTKIPNDYPS